MYDQHRAIAQEQYQPVVADVLYPPVYTKEIIERKQNDTRDSLLKEIEAHFGLSK